MVHVMPVPIAEETCNLGFPVGLSVRWLLVILLVIPIS
jgi:hypothetical protein